MHKPIASTGAAELRRVRIQNSQGLHARPCHALVSASLAFPNCEIEVRCDGRRANGKSILELMTLGAYCGADLDLEARGEQAAQLLDRLEALVSSGFGEGA